MFSNRRRKLKQRKMIVAGLSVVMILLFIYIYFFSKRQDLAVVTIQIENASIYPEETLPAFKVTATADEEVQKIVLDTKEKYRIQNLIEDINQGKGYQVQCVYDSEMPEEGTYPVQLIFSDRLKKNLEENWKEKIKIEIKGGILTIKNALGEWVDDKFKRRDGTYITNEFLCLNKATYYFDEDGKKVIGEREILGKVYYFKEDGTFDDEKNDYNPALPMIALTFDDGPGKYTERLLDALEEYDSRATFFMVGTNVRKYPDAIERMKEIGCEIGNHSTNHARLTELTAEQIAAEIETTNAELKSVIDEGATVVRPPYGAVNDLVKSTVKEPLVFWNVDTLDWENQNVDEIVQYTLKIVKDGDIVLMHDIYETTIDAAIELVEKLNAEGYQLVTVSEMAEARGIVLETGKEYAHFKP